MTPQELRASILQLAIQGKLVPQLPEEGTGEALFWQIQAEKQHLIKTGKIKKEKSLSKIKENEIQFDIPESWRHVRLGEVFCLEMGQSPDGNTVSEIGNGIEFHQGKVYFGKMELQLSPQKTTAPTKYAEPDSVLLCVRAPVGKVNITKRQICIGRGLCAVKPICGVSVEFVYYWLATMENTFVKKATGTTFVAITGDVVKNQVIPLPPIAEQKRIVAKIEELLPLIDRYEQAWSKLEDFNKRFPVDMQKSILQMAIQGKLVPQLPEEGTGEELFQQIQAEKQAQIKAGKIKKEKPLPEIADDEIPFDIPDNWKWVRLGKIANTIFAGGDKPSDFQEMQDSQHRFPVVANGVTNDGILGYTGTPTAKANTITVAGRGTIGFSLYRTYEYCPVVRLIVIEQSSCIHPQYLQCVLKALPEKSLGTSIPQLTVPMLYPKLIPLPPLAEQKRIVAKLEEILPLCEKLK